MGLISREASFSQPGMPSHTSVPAFGELQLARISLFCSDHHHAVIEAPAGTKPTVTYRQSATTSFLAKATIMIRRILPCISPTRP